MADIYKFTDADGRIYYSDEDKDSLYKRIIQTNKSKAIVNHENKVKKSNSGSNKKLPVNKVVVVDNNIAVVDTKVSRPKQLEQLEVNANRTVEVKSEAPRDISTEDSDYGIYFLLILLLFFIFWKPFSVKNKLAVIKPIAISSTPPKRVVRSRGKSTEDLIAKAMVNTVFAIGGGLIKGLIKAGKRK